MKPLLIKDLPIFLKRFGNFIDAEIRSIEILSPVNIKIVIAGQDSARGFDWITVELDFNDVSDAKLIDSDKLHLLDMSNGISLLSKDTDYYFCLDNYSSISSMPNSMFYIKSSNLKYKEGLF